MDINNRNNIARKFNEEKLALSLQLTEKSFESINDYQRISNILKNLIDVQAMGFRGVVATAITGKHLNSNYDPLNNFYGCNPRAIFEQGIFYAFQNKIPCGKSDPLNVAKNINVLDYEWANGKRPQSAAQAAVDFLKTLENAPSDQKEKLINFFYFRLNEYANKVQSIQIPLPENQKWQGQIFGHMLSQFVLSYPESGTIPQFVIHKLLEKAYKNSEICVLGGNESVFGTNTTSKKPSDLWLEKDGKPINLFEVTVKKIDFKRLDDCTQSLNAVNLLNTPITFICRIPDDISSLSGLKHNTLNYNGKIYNFLDIKQFILSQSSLLLEDQMLDLLDEIRNFINSVNRPIQTKIGWSSIFG